MTDTDHLVSCARKMGEYSDTAQLNLARAFLRHIEQESKTWPYLRELTAILRADGLQDTADLEWGWALIRARPDQHARAFIAVFDTSN